MKKVFMPLFVSFLLLVPLPASESDNLIQIAILLDASNSMDGLIDQAKTQLWKIVNELALAKRDGKNPRLEVAFYEYGKDEIPRSQGHLRAVVPLSTDLDKISEELFTIKTNGGDEYCGQVINHAVQHLAWNPGRNVLKEIFIAGNEPFTQGTLDYAGACKSAIGKGIIVNTVFCGSREDGIASKWKDGADLADGNYINIDQNQAVEHIPAPQDSVIARLGAQINKTYIAYGAKGKTSLARQSKQDAAVASFSGEASVQRSIAKSSKQYDNSGWDLVDARKNKNVNVHELKDSELPDEMKGMNRQEREQYIEKKQTEREALQSQIEALNIERKKYIAQQRIQSQKNNTLDQAIIETIHKQAKAKGFTF